MHCSFQNQRVATDGRDEVVSQQMQKVALATLANSGMSLFLRHPSSLMFAAAFALGWQPGRQA